MADGRAAGRTTAAGGGGSRPADGAHLERLERARRSRAFKKNDRKARRRARRREPLVQAGGVREPRGQTPAGQTPSAAAAAKRPQLSAEECDKARRATMKEFVHLHDLKEAELCVRELTFDDDSRLVSTALDMAVNSSPKDQQTRDRLVELTAHVCGAGIVPREAVRKGVCGMLGDMDDLSIDVPKAPQFYAEFVAALVVGKLLDLKALLEAVPEGDFVDFGGAAKMLQYLLKAAVRLSSTEEAAALLNASGVDCQTLLRKSGPKVMTDLKLWAADNDIAALFP